MNATREQRQDAYRTALTEAQFMQQVLDYAALTGWRVFHDHDSRRNAAGLPDLLLVRRRRLILAELKTNTGRLSKAQKEWLAALNWTPAEVFVWRPTDWADIQLELR